MDPLTIGAVSNAPLASAPGKEFYLPILGALEIHGGRVKREKFMSGFEKFPIKWVDTIKNIHIKIWAMFC